MKTLESGKHVSTVRTLSRLTDTLGVTIPSGSTFFGSSRGAEGDPPAFYLAHWYGREGGAPVSIPLLATECEATWDWDRNEDDTINLPFGVVKRINDFCNLAYAATDPDIRERALFAISSLTGLGMGPDYDHTQEPIFQALKRKTDALWGNKS